MTQSREQLKDILKWEETRDFQWMPWGRCCHFLPRPPHPPANSEQVSIVVLIWISSKTGDSGTVRLQALTLSPSLIPFPSGDFPLDTGLVDPLSPEEIGSSLFTNLIEPWWPVSTTGSVTVPLMRCSSQSKLKRPGCHVTGMEISVFEKGEGLAASGWSPARRCPAMLPRHQ